MTQQFRLVTDEAHHIGDPVNRIVEPGQVFDVDDDNAPAFAQSPERFQPVKAVKLLDEMTIPELQAYAAPRGIDLTGLTLKADILAAVKKES